MTQSREMILLQLHNDSVRNTEWQPSSSLPSPRTSNTTSSPPSMTPTHSLLPPPPSPPLLQPSTSQRLSLTFLLLLLLVFKSLAITTVAQERRWEEDRWRGLKASCSPSPWTYHVRHFELLGQQHVISINQFFHYICIFKTFIFSLPSSLAISPRVPPSPLPSPPTHQWNEIY